MEDDDSCNAGPGDRRAYTACDRADGRARLQCSPDDGRRQQTILAGVGTPAHFEVAEFKVLPGVHDAYRISSPYKLAGRSFRPEGTTITFPNGVVVGGEEVVVMAGPCSVESREQILLSAKQVGGGGREVSARRRVQAAELAVQLPGHGAGRVEAAARGRRMRRGCW